MAWPLYAVGVFKGWCLEGWLLFRAGITVNVAIARVGCKSYKGTTMRFFDWHQRPTEWWLDRLGMKSYAALWFAYLKGVVTTLFVLWVFGYW